VSLSEVEEEGKEGEEEGEVDKEEEEEEEEGGDIHCLGKNMGCLRNTLQYTATRCNTLQHLGCLCKNFRYHSESILQVPLTATHCNTLQYTATQRNAIHCNTLQYTITHCNTLQYTETRFKLW